MADRNTAPVFVTGCHRSGTNLLYDTLLSSGQFALYQATSFVYEILVPRFGNLRVLRNRQKLMHLWLRSKAFRRSGLDAKSIEARVLAECRNGGDFLNLVMGEIALRQNVPRWAVYGPDNLLWIPQIKQELPRALFIHIIRDGRDIALSLTKMGGLRPLPWDRKRGTLATTLYWEWMVRKGRKAGRAFPEDYREVHYEDLVLHPRETLAEIGQFIGQDLDYDRIQSAAIGTLSRTNSTFGAESSNGTAPPVNRWRQKLSDQEATEIEALAGDCLREFGYSPETSGHRAQTALPVKLMRAVYPRFFDFKLWLKSPALLGRLVSTGPLEIEDDASSSLP